MLDCHLENDLVQRGLLCELPLSAILGAVLKDVLEGDSGPLHEGCGDCPVVLCGSKCDGSVLDADLPLLVEGCREDVHDLLVELSDELGELLDHHLLGNLLFDDCPVDLVDEEEGPDALLQSLPDDSLGLRHESLDCTTEDECSVECPHCTGNVSTEVDVTGSVDEVDEVGLLSELVDHRCACCVDGDSTCCLLLVEVEDTLVSCELLRHHSGTCNQVVRESGLSVIDMCGSSNVPDDTGSCHKLNCFLDVVFLSAH